MPYVLLDENESPPKRRGYVLLEDPPATPESTGKQINQFISGIPRQLGLTARYALEGPAQALQIFTEPIAEIQRAIGIPTNTTGQAASDLADWIGLPKPEGSAERVVGDATRALAGGGAFLGGARAAAALPGLAGSAGAALSTAPTSQLTSAAGAGLMGGLSREGGGNALQQAAASTLGGIAGFYAPQAAGAIGNTLANSGKRMLNITVQPQQLDAQLNLLFERSGADYSKVPERVRQTLRAEAAQAMQTGRELSPDAIRRLADFTAVGATPTRGMISQDPVQITREMNLAKTGANASDSGLQGLARVQNQNNTRLINVLNEAGASRGDQFRAGQNAINAIRAQDEAMGQNVTGLYNSARAMPGGDVPLNRPQIVNGIFEALARENKMAYLPENISNMLNMISQGQVTRNGQTFNVPFTANTLDNLMTDIATAQRGTQDGNVKAALKIARDAIDRAGVSPVKREFGGNQMVTQEGANFLRSQDAAAGDFMTALNQARGAARSRFQWQDSSRPVEAALGGAQPDNFVQKFVINGTVDDTRALVRELGARGGPNAVLDPRNPTAASPGLQEIKDAVVAHLKSRALGGASDEVGKFSQSAYNRALESIGDRKLALIFSPEEIARLRQTGRVASYMQNQPVGSAVNNSNSGALLLGRGLDALNNIPVIGPMVGPAISNARVTLQQRAAQDIAPSLLMQQQRQPMLPGLLGPLAVTSGGLLSPQPLDR